MNSSSSPIALRIAGLAASLATATAITTGVGIAGAETPDTTTAASTATSTPDGSDTPAANAANSAGDPKDADSAVAHDGNDVTASDDAQTADVDPSDDVPGQDEQGLDEQGLDEQVPDEQGLDEQGQDDDEDEADGGAAAPEDGSGDQVDQTPVVVEEPSSPAAESDSHITGPASGVPARTVDSGDDSGDDATADDATQAEIDIDVDAHAAAESTVTLAAPAPAAATEQRPASTTVDLTELPRRAVTTAFGPILSFINGVLGFFGLGPMAAPAAAAPSTPDAAPTLWGLLAWVRREFERSFFNRAPTIGYNPAQNTLVDGVVTGNLNIFDADGDPLTVTFATPPRGSLVVHPDGTFTYTPDGAMATAGGLDIFNITVNESNTADHMHGIGGLIHALTFGLVGPNLSKSTTPVLVTAGAVQVTLPPDGYGFAEGFDLITLNQEDLDRELDAVVRAHGQWLRVPIPWAMIETSPGQYDWTVSDRLINAAAARNLKVLANIFYAPAWTRDSQMYSPPADLTTMASFTTKLVQRYGDTVSNWQIWNEPNLPAFFGNQPDRARKYAAMLKATYTAIKAVQPDSTVVAAGMAIDVGTESPVGFLQQMYAAGAAGYFDAYAMHPYTGPGGIASDPYNAWSDVARVHDLMTAHGDGTKKIWLTEIGGATDCQLCSAFAPILGPLSVTTSQQDQTAHILEIFSAAAQTDYIGPVFIFSIRDQGLLPEINGHAHMGSLLTNDWQPKYTAWVLANAVSAT